MIDTKDQAKPGERCLSRFPHSHLDVQCQRDEGHEADECAALMGHATPETYPEVASLAGYTWPTALNVVAL